MSTAAAERALARYERNKSTPAEGTGFWKSCAWAMADDLRRTRTHRPPMTTDQPIDPQRISNYAQKHGITRDQAAAEIRDKDKRITAGRCGRKKKLHAPRRKSA